MNELIVQEKLLPDNLPELAAFVLVGREKLTAVRAEIRAINKLKLAEEVRQQKRDEAFMLSEALLDAEKRIGELTKKIPIKTGTNSFNVLFIIQIYYNRRVIKACAAAVVGTFRRACKTHAVNIQQRPYCIEVGSAAHGGK